MKFKTKLIASVATLALGVCVETASAQLPAGLPGGLSGGGPGSAASSAATDRVQAQVQQRARLQVQQRMQAQVQTRAQAQLQSRIEAESQRAAQIALRAASHASQRAQEARQSLPDQVRFGANVNANAAASLKAADKSARLGSKTRVGLGAGFDVPPGLTKADVAIYDNLFGQFNPLRQPRRNNGEASSQSQSGERASEKNTQERDSLAVEQRDEARGGTRAHVDVNGIVTANHDFASRVRIAARHRRAEISQMRDQAIATGQAELLVRADELERRLDAFTAAEARIRAQSQQASQTLVEKGTNTATEAAASTAVRAATDANAAGSASLK